jgi:thiamine pyrophosphate-dependent acetolactate synthase large subunit-like protein
MTTLSRAAALRGLAERRSDEVVVATMTPLSGWHALQQSDLDLPCVGAMGSASSLALGIALGQPERKVWVLDGDGSLLMQLGSLATIGAEGPRNFYHFVFHNGVYAFSGDQEIPGGMDLDFAAMALAAGYREGHVFDDIESLQTSLDEILAQPGPVLIQLKVTNEDDGLPQREIPMDPGERGRRLRKILAGK